MYKKVSLTALIFAPLFVITALNQTALAQSGSRLCGYVTTSTEPTIPGFAMAVVFEARKNNSNYTAACDKAISEIKGKIPSVISVPGKSGAVQVKLTWTQKRKSTCESVGKPFAGQGIGEDICDHMNANNAYKITKLNTQTKAVFEKQ